MHKNLDIDANQKHKYEFRLRFKLPLASKLLEIDKIAFDYYYKQVKRDYLANIVCSNEVKAQKGKNDTNHKLFSALVQY